MTLSRLKIMLLALAAGFMAAAAMWPSARNGFVWDDVGYVCRAIKEIVNNV